MTVYQLDQFVFWELGAVFFQHWATLSLACLSFTFKQWLKVHPKAAHGVCLKYHHSYFDTLFFMMDLVIIHNYLSCVWVCECVCVFFPGPLPRPCFRAPMRERSCWPGNALPVGHVGDGQVRGAHKSKHERAAITGLARLCCFPLLRRVSHAIERPRRHKGAPRTAYLFIGVGVTGALTSLSPGDFFGIRESGCYTIWVISFLSPYFLLYLNTNMSVTPEYLVLLYTTTCGASGELLGSDEKEIVQLLWQVFNFTTKTVNITLLSVCVKPATWKYVWLVTMSTFGIEFCLIFFCRKKVCFIFSPFFFFLHKKLDDNNEGWLESYSTHTQICIYMYISR